MAQVQKLWTKSGLIKV